MSNVETILAPHPLVRIGLMAHALRHRIPAIRLSAGWLCQWFEDCMVWLAGKRTEVRAIDDALEHANAQLKQLRPMLAHCLRNDPPAQRRQLLAAIDAEIRAAHATHAATEAAAASLVPPCPESLPRNDQDKPRRGRTTET